MHASFLLHIIGDMEVVHTHQKMSSAHILGPFLLSVFKQYYAPAE